MQTTKSNYPTSLIPRKLTPNSLHLEHLSPQSNRIKGTITLLQEVNYILWFLVEAHFEKL